MRKSTDIHLTMAGEWGWHCDACGAQSRYVYLSKSHARRLATSHARYCRGRKPLKAARR